MSERREYDNPYQDFSRPNTVIDPRTNDLSSELKEQLMTNIQSLVKYFEKNYKKSSDRSDYSVYTGVSGIALMYLHLYSTLPIDQARKEELLNKAFSSLEQNTLQKIIQYFMPKRYTFLCGDCGPLAIAAVLNHKINNHEKSMKYIRLIESLVKHVCDVNSDIPDEILYGRSGFLYTLLYLRNNIEESKSIITDEIIRSVVEAILRSGIKTSKQLNKKSSPLMYYWHGKAYVGGAHGICGIMYMLLKVKHLLTDEELNNLVKPTIDFVLSLRLSSGNYPSSLESSTSDRLVQWCHGAPGTIHLFALAYQVFKQDKYLKAAYECGDVIWKRGLLRKGYGICHGTSGNAYGFLILYQVTNDEKHLYRAYKFAEWCYDYGKHNCRTPDRPYSLYEGLAGTIYYLADLLNPKNSCFPAF